MKVRIKDVLAANAAIQYMEINGGVPFKIVRDLSKMRNALTEEVRIANQEQIRIMDELGGKPNENDMVYFPSVKAREEFEKAWVDILETEVEINLDRLDLSSLADNIIFQNSNVDVEALSAFIDFDGQK